MTILTFRLFNRCFKSNFDAVKSKLGLLIEYIEKTTKKMKTTSKMKTNSKMKMPSSKYEKDKISVQS